MAESYMRLKNIVRCFRTQLLRQGKFINDAQRLIYALEYRRRNPRF